MIKEVKNCEGSYTIFDTKTYRTVDIERIHEYSLTGKSKVRYRVDMGGRTQYSLLPLTEAKKKARQLLKK